MASPLRTPCSTISDESTDKNDTLKISVEGRLESLPDVGHDTMITIFRVPAHVREANKELYEPRMVSIGPYYHGREELRAMEQLKLRYLRDFFGRGAWDQTSALSSYIEAVREVEERARRSYYEETELSGIGNKEAAVQWVPSCGCGSPDIAEQGEHAAQCDGLFAEMLLLDGCFILELLFKRLEEDDDSLQRVGWGLDLLKSDLLLLENQIPFFVLVSLYAVLCIGRAPIPTPKDQLVHDLFRLLLPNDALISNPIVPRSVFDIEIHHLLHLYHEAYLPKPEPRNMMQPVAEAELDKTVIPCTTQLREAGVRFKRKESPKHMFDITFSDGVMEIPRLEIDHARSPLLVNLIAFEQCTGKKGAAAALTSYTALIRTGKDVQVLQKHGIINNMLSSEDDVAMSYFNHLAACSTLDYDKQYYAPEFAQLNKHYKSNWNKYKAMFRRDYFANPWSIVSFLVAVLVFSFAISQVSINFYRLKHSPH
uniref:Uncharacterized protein n=1 Tax=Avena sativa TaxID=4498 RepID=A0ACD5ZBR2_AVESA